MKKIQSKYLFGLKIAVIVALSLCAAWLFLEELYFSAALVLLLLIGIAVSLYIDRKRMIARMERMIAGIRHSDFSYHFVQRDSRDELFRLSQEMDEALAVFRRQTHDAMLDEAETKAWQKLIRVLTHEIMNSIAPIISLSETLSEREAKADPSPEEYLQMKQAMETIHRRSRGLLTFVDNYRSLTRISEPVMLPIPIKSMLDSLQRLVSVHQIHFSFQVFPEPLILLADRDMLEQMLINLLKNAREACVQQSDPKISVKAARVGEEVFISVADNGCGIQPEVVEKIFIPFYTTKKEGSGIGLSLCRQMMLRHKGHIYVKTSEKGSEFSLCFPA